MIMSPIPGTQAVTRAVSLLKQFSEAEPELALAALARGAGLHRATAHRLLSALEREGMIARDVTGERYRLGPEAIALGARAARATDLRAVARGELLALAALSGETATLEVPAGADMLIVDEVAGKALISASASAGTRWPAHATSTGKAVLAALTAEDRRRVLGRRLARCTPRTVTSFEALGRELERTARQGFAVAAGELEPGYAAVGAVVRDPSGRPVAALSVGSPSARLPARRLRQLGPAVRDAAARVSRTLGYDGRDAR